MRSVRLDRDPEAEDPPGLAVADVRGALRVREREVAKERKRIEKDLKRRGIDIPVTKLSASTHPGEQPSQEDASKPTFSNIIEQSKWEEEQRLKQLDEQRKLVQQNAPPKRTAPAPAQPPPQSSVEKAAPATSGPKIDTAKVGGIAARLKAIKEKEEAMERAKQESKEQDVKKKREAEEAWRKKEADVARQKAAERVTQQSASAGQSNRTADVVSSTPVNPLEELERIKAEAAKGNEDSYFVMNPKS